MRRNGKFIESIINSINELEDNPRKVLIVYSKDVTINEEQKKFIMDAFKDKEIVFNQTDTLDGKLMYVVNGDYQPIRQPMTFDFKPRTLVEDDRFSLSNKNILFYESIYRGMV